ncbi:MAG: alpha/beta hydrolase [Blautia sp.]|nr:alpha/beta hydrolase [Blautia sp.]
MNYKELIDPELKKGARTFPFNRGVAAAGNVFLELTWRFTAASADIEEKRLVTKGCQGFSLKTSVFSPAGAGNHMPALIYVHGGGFAYKAAAYQKKLAFIYAKKAGCRVFFPHYHLAPRHKYPFAYEDVLSLFRYVVEHAGELGVATERIGIAGDSAGASIAALICNRWEEAQLQRPCLQMLIYPVTDAEMRTESMKRFADTPVWNSRQNERMWFYYCGGDQDLRLSASPMHSPLPSVVPKTYIETAEYDCLHDEGLLYGEKLKKAGADVEIHETRGTYHGYDAQLDTEIVKQNLEKRAVFLQDGFKET